MIRRVACDDSYGFFISSAKSPEVMLAFYRRLFPYKPFFLWLNQEQGKSPCILNDFVC